MATEEALLLNVKRGIPGAFLWRARTDADGHQQEELLSEHSLFQVANLSLCVKLPAQPPQFLCHSELTGPGQAYLLLYHSKSGEPPVQFSFDGCGLRCSEEDVEYAVISILLAGAETMGLSSLVWTENGQTQGAFLGSSQQRVIRYLNGACHILANRGRGTTHAE